MRNLKTTVMVRALGIAKKKTDKHIFKKYLTVPAYMIYKKFSFCSTAILCSREISLWLEK